MWFLCDQAYVGFRYAANLELGHGLRFNLGPQVPVEGYSSFLWVVIGAVTQWWGFRQPDYVPQVSAMLAGILLVGVFWAARVYARATLTAAALATLVLSTAGPFAVWSSGGLETAALSLLFFVAAERMILSTSPRAWVGASMAASLLVLVRTEGFVWALGVALAARWVHGRDPAFTRRLRPYLWAILLTFAGYGVWRLGYYQTLIPNVVYAKGGVTLVTLFRGAVYVAYTAITFLTPVAAVAVTWPVAREDRRVAALLALAAGVVGWAVIQGGDALPMGRLIVPALPLVALASAWGLQRISDRYPGHGAWLVVGASLALVPQALPLYDHHLVPAPIRSIANPYWDGVDYLSEYKRWRHTRLELLAASRRGWTLRKLYGEGDSMVDLQPGASGYFSGLYIHDRRGLVSPDVARRMRDPGEPYRLAGYDKAVGPMFFHDARPTVLDSALLRSRDAAKRGALLLGTWEQMRSTDGVPVSREYVPDLIPVRNGPPDLWMLMLRRKKPEEAAREVWSQLEERLGML